MKIYLNFVLHIYQPPTQTSAILKQIIKESYDPLFDFLTKNEHAKMTFNINGSLLELLNLHQENQLLDKIRELHQRKQIDFLGSSCYHAILPLIPEEEIIRQITLNEQFHDEMLGKDALQSRGFWLPEMAYDYRIIDSIKSKGYLWTVLSSVAVPDKKLPRNFIPVTNNGFITYFRNDLLSNFISFKHPTVNEFYKELKRANKSIKGDSYIILAMDGETFGHHLEGLIEDFLEPLIAKIQSDPDVELAKIAELPNIFSEQKEILPRASSWSTSEEDIQKGIPFPLWSDPNNSIHNLQLLVMNHTLFLVDEAQKLHKNKPENANIQQRFTNARSWLDQGLHSCQFWWASKKPWYSSEMILKGLNQLILAASEALKVILFSKVNQEQKTHALQIFDEIFTAQKELYLQV
jgi:alpha-amylase/alpha-mannosidase (GH57 family)